MRPSTPASAAFCARLQRGHHVEDGETGVLERARVPVGSPADVVTNRDALVDDEVDDRVVAHERLRDVHAERLVGEVAHAGDLVADRVELARTPSR